MYWLPTLISFNMVLIKIQHCYLTQNLPHLLFLESSEFRAENNPNKCHCMFLTPLRRLTVAGTITARWYSQDSLAAKLSAAPCYSAPESDVKWGSTWKSYNWTSLRSLLVYNYEDHDLPNRRERQKNTCQWSGFSLHMLRFIAYLIIL